MSVKASSWAWDQRINCPEITDKEFIVLLYLADKAGDNGLSWHSRKKIQTQCKIKNIRSVSNIFKSLEQKNLITRYKRFTSSGDQTSNAVVVMFEGRVDDDSLGFIDETMRYMPENKGVTQQLPPENIGVTETLPPPNYTVTPPSLESDPKRNINNSETTTTTTGSPQKSKIPFEAFLSLLITTVSDMISEGGWVSGNQPEPKNAWLRTKSIRLYEKFNDPCPADCAALVLKDWTRVISISNQTIPN